MYVLRKGFKQCVNCGSDGIVHAEKAKIQAAPALRRVLEEGDQKKQQRKKKHSDYDVLNPEQKPLPLYIMSKPGAQYNNNGLHGPSLPRLIQL
jgi:hypothetical protein